MEVVLDYKPRPWQSRFEKEIGSRRRAFLLWARRHGKDIASWNYLILQAIQKRGSYYYLYPRQNQARKAIWEGMTSAGKRFLDYIPKELQQKDPNNSEMLVTLINGSIIRILGSDNHDALRSSNPIGVVFSEYAFHHPLTWSAVVEPILQENKGWALFNTTPFGKNHAYDLWRYAQEHPETWYTEKVTNDDSKIITDEEFEEMRKRGVSEETILQEYFCHFDRGVEGSYYARILNDIRLNNQITNIPKDDYAQVHTAWDLGYGDSTAIWFYQVVGKEVHILDYYENHGEGLAHYINVLEDKRIKNKYLYGYHFVPHDASAGSFEIGMSRVKYATELGLKMTVLPRESIDMGIERVRKYLPKTYFDKTKCDYGLKCIENYQKRYNAELNVYSDTPLHNYASHCCFTGETLIDTSKGKIRIDSIKEGDLVLTPNGYRKVLQTHSKIAAELREISGTGFKLKCTAEHKIFSDKGLVYSDSLRYHDVLYSSSWVDRMLCRTQFGSGSKGTDTGFRVSFLSAMMRSGSSSMATPLHGTVDTMVGEKDCTELSGGSIMGRLKRVFISIIKMEMLKTIASKICNAFLNPSIISYMPGIPNKSPFQEEQLKLQENMPLSGIDRKKEGHGISFMENRHWQKESPLQKVVKFVERSIKRCGKIDLGSVATIANQGRVSSLAWTMKLGFVRFVRRLLSAIDICPQKRVQGNVAVFMGSEEVLVYDLSVDVDNCYYANGILVSNSDALRYLFAGVELHQSGSSHSLEEYRSMKKKYGHYGIDNPNSILGN